MFSKFIGVFTGFTAALLLVGLAWATNSPTVDEFGGEMTALGAHCDDSHDHDHDHDHVGSEVDADVLAAAEKSDYSGLGTEVKASGEVAADSNDGSNGDADNDSESDSNSGTTTTTAADVTTTTVERGDSDDDTSDVPHDHEHFLLDITGDVQMIDAGEAGTLKVKALLGHLLLIDVDTNAGWDYEVRKYTTSDIEIRFFGHGAYTDLDIEVSHEGLIVDLDVFAD